LGALPELHDLAVNVAKDAVGELRVSGGAYREVEKNLPRDVKVLGDRKLEKLIVAKLVESSGYPVLAEEKGLTGEKEGHEGFWWIVDPLDGSLNFSRGIPISCVSIGLWRSMEPLLGVVYDFNRNEVFSGMVGKGAWVNGYPMQVSKVVENQNAVLCTGFPVGTDFSQKPLLSFVTKIREFKKIRLLGSAAISLAYVACGKADIYMENDIKIWDVAAGLALVKAAGGVVQYSRTDLENGLKVKATNKLLNSGATSEVRGIPLEHSNG